MSDHTASTEAFNDEIFNKVKGVIERDLGIDSNVIDIGTSFESINVDSLSMTEMFLRMEDEFEIRFEDGFSDFKTLRELVANIDRMVIENAARRVA